MNKRGFWQHVKHFKSSSMLVKDFALIFSVSALIFIAVSLGFYLYYSDIVTQAVSVSNLNALSRVRDFVDLVSKEAERLSLFVSNDEQINLFLKEEISQTDSYKTVERISTVRSVLSRSSIASDYLYAVELYSFNNDYFVSSNGINGKISRSAISIPEMPEDKKIWVQVQRNDLTDKSSLVYYKKLFADNGTAPDGLLCVLVDLDVFGRQIEGTTVKNYEELFLVDENGMVLYASPAEIIGEKVDNVPILKYYMQSEDKKTLSFNDKKLFVTKVESEYKRWHCISLAVSEHYFDKEINYLKTLLFASILISVVIAGLGAVFISLRMFEPINLLLELVQGKKAFKIPQKRKPAAEFEIIIRDILDNYKQNNEMKQQLLSKQIMLNKAQNIAMQAQINPHFLYNTLENINWRAMALTKGSNEVSRMIVMLSNLLRFYLKTEDALICVRNEIEYAKLYMDILLLRFDNSYTVTWDIDEKLNECKIVKVTLQPLLENAVIHGVEKGQDDKFIKVSGYLKQDYGVIEIVNSGPCLSEEEVLAINTEMHTDILKENTSIGMSNVNRRIKLHFGERYGLTASITKQGHTCISVSFPPEEE